MNEEELKNRIKNAILILQDFNSFKVGELIFKTKDEKSFSVTGWTIRSEFKNITKSNALIELNMVKSLFKRMIQISPELSDFVKQRQIKFSLGYEYGMGGIEICSEIDGQIKWEAEIKE